MNRPGSFPTKITMQTIHPNLRSKRRKAIPKRRRDRKVLGIFDDKEVQPDYVQQIYAHRHLLLKRQTKCEKLFEQNIGRPLWRLNAKYRQQSVFFLADQVSFIADFHFREFDFIVEIDGSSHYKNKDYDKWRDESLLEHCGVKTIRFRNSMVEKAPNEIFKAICDEILENGRPKSRAYKMFEKCYNKHRDGWLVEHLGERDTVDDFEFAVAGL
jgi:very-short-patch-repair endonuclease